MESRIFHLHTLTALHVGVGQGAGVVDLPIAREKSTHLPLVPGSAIKGVLREEYREDMNAEDRFALFGPDTDKADLHAGALTVGDARLLCLPVRSLAGTFAYATCPLVLHRYVRDWQALNPKVETPAIPNPAEGGLVVAEKSALTMDNKVYLEDLDLNVGTSADKWAEFIASRVFPDDPTWQDLFRERFAILTDADFDFLAETATEIRARIKLKEDTRTVEKGALWYEENLPAETVLWGLAAADRSFRGEDKRTAGDMLALLPKGETTLQIGGKATVGRGRTRWIWPRD